MYRFKSKKVKTGGIVLVFSLLVMGSFLGILACFVSLVGIDSNSGYGIYLFSQSDYEQMVENAGYIQINPYHIVSEYTYRTDFLNDLLHHLIPVTFLFFIVLFILSLGLWQILKRKKEKEMLQIAQQMSDAVTMEVYTDEPALEVAYKTIRQMFEDRLSDYKRLNSYLSHDQKNVLAMLRTMLELSNQKEYLSSIDYLTASIDDMLTLSENVDSLTCTDVDLSLICAEVCDRYHNITDQIVYDFDDSNDTIIQAKKRWIYRAVDNLLDNAVKYGEGKPIHVSVRSKNGSVILCVRDHGIGIAKEKQDQIFNDRFRVNDLNKDGYGIGLSLVSHVCDLCGGFIMVDSYPGQGAAFYLSFSQSFSSC